MEPSSRVRDPLAPALSLGLLVAIWAVAASLADPRMLPGPWGVAERVASEAAAGELFRHLVATLARVAASFCVAMVAGVAIGIAMARPAVDRWLDAWLIVFLNIPVLVVIVLCYVWIGLVESAAIIAVAINKIPLVAATLREGARARDPALADMATVFRFPPWRRFRHVVLPQLAPYLAAASRTGLALIWKIVLVVELLGRPNGVGFQIHLYFQLFDVEAILAYALSFVAVMLAIEKFAMQPLERRARRWRRV